MNIVDVLIILFLIVGAYTGFKQGFTKSLVNCVGYIVIIILAFILKNPVSEILMSFLPFFDFFGIIKGLTVFNIALYEIIAFILVFGILLIILKILLIATTIFEKVLSFTIILGIPSKILGAIIGVIKNFVIVFGILYIINLTGVASEDMHKSTFNEPILNNTPILTNIAGESVKVAKEFSTIKDKYENTESNNEFNLETLDLFLKYGITTPETTEKLIDNGKLKINGAESVINKYKERNE